MPPSTLVESDGRGVIDNDSIAPVGIVKAGTRLLRPKLSSSLGSTCPWKGGALRSHRCGERSGKACVGGSVVVEVTPALGWSLDLREGTTVVKLLANESARWALMLLGAILLRTR